ncbi:MAG: beta-propeller fold lactonase family protein, partial [Flavobacteriales bacterium]|nr:beta-propeller fold lactonase family protein [Flavobacteriales bacterium]
MADDGDWVLSGDTVHSNGRRVGIGTSAPSRALDVEGSFQLKDGTQADKRILTSDAEGNASWQELSPEGLLGVGNVPPTGLSCIGITGSLGIGPTPISLAISGNYVYVLDLTSDELRVIDISDPSSPMLIGTLVVGDYPQSLAVSGSHAYVLDYFVGELKVIEISDPASPVSVASLGVGPHPSSIAVSGNYAYVVSSAAGEIEVVDISDPASPVLISDLGIGSLPLYLAVSGNYAYVVDIVSDELKVVDISNPASPVLSGSLVIGPNPTSIAVSGNYAYVVDDASDDLKVIDISSPASPMLIGSVSVGPAPVSVAVFNDFAFVVDYGSDDLKVIDVSSPSTPVLSGDLALGSAPFSVAVSGNYAYIGDYGSDDLKVIELFCPTAQQQLVYDPGTGAFVAVEGWQVSADTLHNGAKRVGIGTDSPDTTLHVAGKLKYQDGTQGDKKILTSDAEGNASWQELNGDVLFGAGSVIGADLSCLAVAATIPTGSLPGSVSISGDHAYVVNWLSNNLMAFDISNPASPSLSATIATGTGSNPISVAVSGDHAYVLNYQSNNMKVYDISDPTSPSLSATIATGTDPVSVAVSGDHAYVVNLFSANMMVFDISNPASPSLSATIATGTDSRSVAVSGDHAFVVNSGPDNMMVFDISNPASPSLSATIATGTNPASVAVSGDHAYVLNVLSQNMMVFDISNPASPSLSATIATGSYPRSVAVSGDHAYVVNHDNNNMMVFDISNPALPSLGSTIATGASPVSVAVSGGHAYVLNGSSNNMMIFELFCPSEQQQVTYDPVSGEFNTSTIGWEVSEDTLYTLNRKVGIGISAPSSLLSGTDLGLVDDAGEHARLTMKSNAVKGVLDARSTPGAESMQLGSVSAHPLSFLTNGAARMTLATNGFLGIGTATPAHGLDLRADGQAFGHRSLDSTIAVGTYVDNTYGAFLQTHTDHPLQFATNNGDAQMTLLQNGNVGIGTTTPSAPLDVRDVSATASEFRLSLSSSHWAKFRFSESEGLRIEAKNEGVEFRPMLLIGSELRFMAGTGTTPERMRLASNGYLGIGTTTPIRPLHVTQGSGNPNVVL